MKKEGGRKGRREGGREGGTYREHVEGDVDGVASEEVLVLV